jgi:hypothetical protein
LSFTRNHATGGGCHAAHKRAAAELSYPKQGVSRKNTRRRFSRLREQNNSIHFQESVNKIIKNVPKITE